MSQAKIDVKLISSNFMENERDVINVDHLKKHFIEKLASLMRRDQEFFITDILHEQVNTDHSTYHYFYFESSIPGCTTGMKCYHLGVFSSLLIDRYYYDSNVIGVNHSYTLEDVKKQFSNYVRSLYKDFCK